MRNIRLVAQHEFMTYIRKRSFLFAVVGMPALMAVIFAIIFFVETVAEEQGIVAERIGYVDQADIINNRDNVLFSAFDSEASAQLALDAAEIDAYFVIPQPYIAIGDIPLYAIGTVSEETLGEIKLLLVSNLTSSIETDAPSERLLNPVSFLVFLENNQREISENGIMGLLLVPMLFAAVLIMALQLSSTFLMSGVVEEKTNHIMEILITSITPYELLTGKLLGLGALGLVQLLVWIMVSFIGLAFAGNMEFLAGVSMPLDFIMIILLYFVLTYFVYGSILAGIGAVVGSEQESRTYAGIVSFFVAVPFFFFTLLLFEPESPILKGLMLFPLTAGMTYMLRFPFSNIAFWEIALSLVILAITTLAVVWFSAKVFRWGLLLYGKKPTLFTIWRVIRGPADIGTLSQNSVKKEAGI
jgi:ABC-2 type transport system permease protein